MDMEITFSREMHYSISVGSYDLSQIAKRLGISIKKLLTLIGDGALDDDQKTDIKNWLDEQEARLDITDQSEIEDMEIHIP